MPPKSIRTDRIELPVLQVNNNDTNASQPKPKRQRTRALVLVLVHLVILGHITHFWLTGRSLSPVEPSESMYTIELGQVNAGAIFFALAILSTAIFGRFFCGWGCHLVALQDLSGYLLRRIGFRPKPLRSRLLIWVPVILAFYMFFLPTLKRLWRGDQHVGFSNHLMTDDFWLTFPGAAVTFLTFVVCGGLLVYLLGNKGFCTYACPYGAFFSVADRFALGRIRVTDACQHCGQCTAHCTSNVQVHAEVRDFGMVVDPGCMKCLDCVSSCPNDALYFGLKQKPGVNDSQKESLNSPKPIGSKKNYDYSLPEELFGFVVTGFTVYAIRSLYDITPLLLSVAIGVISAYLAIQFLRVFRKRDLRIQNFQLKRNGRITKIGWLTVGFMCVWFAFVIHSFFVQHFRFQGREQLSRVPTTWLDLLYGRAQSRLTPLDNANIDAALYSYRLADRLGLLDVLEVKQGLAVGTLMKGNWDEAEKYLWQAYECNPPTVREMMMEFLLAQNRPDEAAELR